MGQLTTGLPPGVEPTMASGSVSNIVAGSGGASGTRVSVANISWSDMPSREARSRTALISAGNNCVVRRSSVSPPLRKCAAVAPSGQWQCTQGRISAPEKV